MHIMRTRGWVFTDHAKDTTIDERVKALKDLEDDPAIVYCVVGDEVGEGTGKRHLQGFIRFTNPKGMGGVKRILRSQSVHLEPQRGSNSQASDYCEKENVVVKFGTIPKGSGGSAWDVIIAMVEDGFRNSEIMRRYPEFYARYSTGIDRIRFELAADKLGEYHPVHVEYRYGPTGTGKTRGVLAMADHPRDVYRIQDYRNPWDAYRGQPIVVFEEFRSSLRLEQMLNHLDNYVHELPCRYANKVSAWEQIIICTNVPIEEQFVGFHGWDVSEGKQASWKAFLRRIDCIRYMDHDGEKFLDVPTQ